MATDLSQIGNRPTAMILRFDDGALPVFALLLRQGGKNIGLLLDGAKAPITSPSPQLLASYAGQMGLAIEEPPHMPVAVAEYSDKGAPRDVESETDKEIDIARTPD